MGYSKTGVITYKKKPEKGEPGPKGPFVYPAGIYVQGSDTQYTATALTAPMVVFENQMYILNVVGTVGSQLNPRDDYAANGNKATWVLVPQYKAAYYEIFFADFAKLGSAIFSGDYMLSQHGVDAQGRESTDFEKFNPATNDFTPNIMIDWLRGRLYAQDSVFKGNIYTPLTVINRETWQDYLDIEGVYSRVNWGKSGMNVQIDYWPDLIQNPSELIQMNVMAYPVGREYLGCEVNILVTDVDFGRTVIGYSTVWYDAKDGKFREVVNKSFKRGVYKFRMVDMGSVKGYATPEERYKWMLINYQTVDKDKMLNV